MKRIHILVAGLVLAAGMAQAAGSDSTTSRSPQPGDFQLAPATQHAHVGYPVFAATAGFMRGPLVGVGGGYHFNAHGLTLIGQVFGARVEGQTYHLEGELFEEQPGHRAPYFAAPDQNAVGVSATIIWGKP